MYPQTTSKATVIDRAQFLAAKDPTPPATHVDKPTLYVVSCADPFDGVGAEDAERDRQASLEFLHRLVMG